MHSPRAEPIPGHGGQGAPFGLTGDFGAAARSGVHSLDQRARLQELDDALYAIELLFLKEAKLSYGP
jgi:hypothetical protein